MDLIKNYPFAEEHPINPDTIFDFVIDHMSEQNMLRFESISTIEKWLKSPMLAIKPGQKIVFKSLESAQAYLKQNNDQQLSNDDSEEIDVITADNYSPQWNHYHFTGESLQKSQQIENIQILTVKQPTIAPLQLADVKLSKPKDKRNRSKSPDENECKAKISCQYCNRYYMHISSLNRHEKKDHPNEIGTDAPVKAVPAKRPNNKKTINMNMCPTIVTLNGAESVYS